MQKILDEARAKALAEIAAAADDRALYDLKVKYLGKKGEITEQMKRMRDLSPDARRNFGQLVNEAKEAVEQALEARARGLAENKYARLAESDWLDASLPGIVPPRGHVHPVYAVQRELEEIFTSMGFEILDGPEVETEYNNFEALNIPADHPARDMQDTFWTEDGNLLRTHTSPVQIRGMALRRPPLRLIAPGRVFRYEATDASHENTFWQMEGLMVDRNISVAHLIYFMKSLLREIFKRDMTIRLRPGYFPFVEPGFELDMQCQVCGGAGCSVCKQHGWVELLPCGLVHPNVLSMSQIDPEVYSGFAFGLGLSRLVMMRYGIDDIRHFLSGDLRFVRQFA
ncbi:MAG: phenylalanine--tRNA ligase subunit alpha [Myxococcales bacterium]|nr:MAG: phenylalanine--tRNA ligase subunit alpha [Myxococcales bacterium]